MPVRGQPQDSRLGARRPRGEARRVDPDDGDDAAPGERQDRRERGAYRRVAVTTTTSPPPATDGLLTAEESRETVERIGLRGGERGDGSAEIVRAPSEPGRPPARDPVDTKVAGRPRVACACRIDPAARTATSKLESGGVADRAARVAVEDHDDPVVRPVLELLHHQLPPACARRPVHATKRLALLVLANGVEVEPGRAPQQEPSPVASATAPPR